MKRQHVVSFLGFDKSFTQRCGNTLMLNIFTDLFSQEDPPSMQEESTGGETAYRESYDDVTVDQLLNHIPLVR